MAWADKQQLDKTWKEPGDDPALTILTISGPDGHLPDHAAAALEARFTDGRLFEVAVHYRFPGRSPDFVRARFVTLKKELSLRHGGFRPGGTRRNVDDGLVIKSEAHRITPAEDRGLVLAYTEVRDEKRGDAAAEFSLLYHNGSVAKRKPTPAGGGLTTPDEP
ncbi:MAG: hypothetical protein HKN82_15455 [Akkermansiaceae bacterium]|nr:hypothetical protein [Akkermansiaceae bacterium]NNM28914.1 hypothetical protein [Akkermansiaceae bacterium]